MMPRRLYLSCLALTLACGGDGHRQPAAPAAQPRGVLVPQGIGLDRMRISPELSRRPELGSGLLWTDTVGRPYLLTEAGVVSFHKGAFMPLPIGGALGGAVGILGNQFLVAAGGTLHRFAGRRLQGSVSLSNGKGPVRIAPAAVNAVYVWGGRSVFLLGASQELRLIKTFDAAVTAVAGTGDLTFVATTSGDLWTIRLGKPVRLVLRHGVPFRSMALSPDGYLFAADSFAVYFISRGTEYPVVAGLQYPQVVAGPTHTFVYSPRRQSLYRLRNVVNLERRYGL